MKITQSFLKSPKRWLIWLLMMSLPMSNYSCVILHWTLHCWILTMDKLNCDSIASCNLNDRFILMSLYQYDIVSIVTAHSQTCVRQDALHNLRLRLLFTLIEKNCTSFFLKFLLIKAYLTFAWFTPAECQ